MTLHEIAASPDDFLAVLQGRKPFVSAPQGRSVVIGDVVILRERNSATGPYTGATCVRRVTYVAAEEPDGLPALLGISAPGKDPAAALNEDEEEAVALAVSRSPHPPPPALVRGAESLMMEIGSSSILPWNRSGARPMSRKHRRMVGAGLALALLFGMFSDSTDAASVTTAGPAAHHVAAATTGNPPRTAAVPVPAWFGPDTLPAHRAELEQAVHAVADLARRVEEVDRRIAAAETEMMVIDRLEQYTTARNDDSRMARLRGRRAQMERLAALLREQRAAEFEIARSQH